jgi:signal transduction histidine kinase
MTPVRRLRTLNTGALLAFATLTLALAFAARAAAHERALDAELSREANRLNELPGTWAAARHRSAIEQPLLFVQITDRAGDVVSASETLGQRRLPIDPPRLARALGGEAWLESVSVEGHTLRMYVAPLRLAGETEPEGPLGAVEVARVVEPPPGRELGALAFGIFVAALVAGPLAFASGTVMMRLALAPIDGFVSTVRAVRGTGDLRVRLHVDTRHVYPALSRLAFEMNGMLARLETATNQVEAALSAQRRFVADASHELRTPLTSLRGNIDLLREGAHSVEQRAILDDVAAEAGRMGRLVQDLLLLAEADAGRHLRLEPIELADVLGRSGRAARPLRTDVELRLLTESAPPIWVLGDRDRLEQVLLVLLENAFKVSPPRASVSVDLQRVRRGERWGAEVRVSDSGPGVAPEERERIFERFYRSDRARTGQGPGLGLAIARWIVEEHAGTLVSEDGDGSGATFVLWLPLMAAPGDR